MKYTIQLTLILLVTVSFFSCGKNPCSGCLDLGGQVEAANSTTLDWLYYGPNVFNSYEQSISVHLGGDFNDTPSSLTEIDSYRVTISKGDNLLIDQSELSKVTGNVNSGYKITIPVTTVTESISKGSEILDFDILVVTDSDQTFILDGKIQYIDCNLIDFEDFDATECRWTCQLGPISPLGNGCVFCF